MKRYLEISINATKIQQELLLPTMIEIGCHGFEEKDDALLCYIDKALWNEKKFEQLKIDLKNLLNTISSNSIIEIKEIEEKNWNAEWERTIQPIEIGNKLVIKPSWAEYQNLKNRIVIQIDPKMSFGTGYHETTRLTLRLIEKYIKAGDRILDIGTGTGILAISAIKLGASYALAIDNDEWSIENAKENVTANNLTDKITISDRSLEEIEDTNFDLITANIMLNTILEMLPEIKKRIKTDGIILFSGLLSGDEEKFLEGIKSHNFKIVENISEGEWFAYATIKHN